ncbi:MAG: hypothetical protein Q9210_004559, partial [Variospora velana]
MPCNAFCILQLQQHWSLLAGTSPGRLVETDSQGNIIAQHPQDVPGNANILKDNFNPHGLTIDWVRNIILTPDYIVPLSILKPSLGRALKELYRVGGIQDVKFIAGNKESAALATAVHLGQIWIIYPFITDTNGKQPSNSSTILDPRLATRPQSSKSPPSAPIPPPMEDSSTQKSQQPTTSPRSTSPDLKNPKRLDNPDKNQSYHR